MITQPECRWGILGTAGIARKLWNAIATSETGVVGAVASRNPRRASTFIRECSSEMPMETEPKSFGSYEALIHHDGVDAVYIPLPTAIRKPFVLEAARAGKHVLCEKPSAVNAADLEEMMEACESSGVQFMDGVMFDHSIRWSAFRKHLHCDAKGIGEIRRIQTHFSFPGDATFQVSNIRTNAQLEPHGCLGDLGWYCIRFTLGVMKGELPVAVEARTLESLSASESKGSVPGEFSAQLFYDNGPTASFFCSFLTANQQTATVSGDNGYASMDDFVLPFDRDKTQFKIHRNHLEINGGHWDFQPSVEMQSFDESPIATESAQEVRMITQMNQIVLSGSRESRFHEVSLKTQRILDACRRSDAAGGTRVNL